jgi:hypothetical protein
MKTIAQKSARLVGLVFMSALTTLFLNAIFSALFAIITQSNLLPIMRSDVMICLSFLLFVVLIIWFIDILTSPLD